MASDHDPEEWDPAFSDKLFPFVRGITTEQAWS